MMPTEENCYNTQINPLKYLQKFACLVLKVIPLKINEHGKIAIKWGSPCLSLHKIDGEYNDYTIDEGYYHWTLVIRKEVCNS